MKTWKIKVLLVPVALGLSILWGYRSERHVMDSAGNRPVTLRSTVRHLLAPESRSVAIERLETLRHAGGRAGFRPRDSAECWSIIRSFNVEDVQAYLADLPSDPKSESIAQLTGMLFYRWAQMDGIAAGNAVLQPPYNKDRSAVFPIATAFLGRDIDGAMRWAASSGSDDAKRIMGDLAGRLLAIQDPQHALDRAAAEYPSAIRSVIQSLFQRMGDTEESYRQFLSLTLGKVSPDEWGRSINGMAYEWSRKPPEETQTLLAEFERAGVAADQLESFRKELIRGSINQSPEQSLDRMLLPESPTPPDQPLEAYVIWSYSHADEAAAWALKNDKSDFISDTVKKQSLLLLRNGWQPGMNDNSTWVSGVRSQFKSWQQHQPDAADAWLQTMPGDLRADFNKTRDETTR